MRYWLLRNVALDQPIPPELPFKTCYHTIKTNSPNWFSVVEILCVEDYIPLYLKEVALLGSRYSSTPAQHRRESPPASPDHNHDQHHQHLLPSTYIHHAHLGCCGFNPFKSSFQIICAAVHDFSIPGHPH